MAGPTAIFGIDTAGLSGPINLKSLALLQALSGSGNTGLSWASFNFLTATKLDPASLEDASTVLGATSADLVLASGVQGRPDADKDPLTYLQAIEEGIVWTNYDGILVRLSADVWPSGGVGGIVYIHVGCTTTTDLGTMVVAWAGAQIQNGGAVNSQCYTHGGAATTNTSNAGALSGTSVFVWIPFNANGPAGSVSTVQGGTSTRTESLDLAAAASNLNLALAFGTSAGLSSNASFENLVAEYALIAS